MVADGPSVKLTRRIAAPPARVWAACTDPALLMRWFGPKGFQTCEVEADVRVGGRFAFRMKGADGIDSAEGVYRVVEPPLRLQLTWRWTESTDPEGLSDTTSIVTFDLASEGEYTRFTLTHEHLPDQAQADSHEEGWTQALDKLDALLALQRKM